MATRRPIQAAAVSLAAAIALGACSLIPGASSDIKRIYIKDYLLNVSARHVGGTSSKDFEDTKSQSVRALGNVGLTYSPNYTFVSDPELLLAVTSPVQFPPGSEVEEPAAFNAVGELTSEKVLRKPIFIINKTTITYSVPGFTIAPVTLTQEIPLKANEYHLKLTGVSQVNELMAAFSQDPSKRTTVAGTATVAVEIQDLDPLARAKTFVVSRSLPLAYSYVPFTPETTASSAPVPVIVLTTPPSATPTPAPTPTATPTPSP